MIKIAVCDDEILIRQELKNLINKQLQEVEVSEFSSGEELLESKERYDITFLDISMEDLSGIEVAKHIRHKQEKEKANKDIIVFVTSYRDYMEDAFDVNAYHYLVKPINEEKLANVLNRATKEIIARKKQTKQYIMLKNASMQNKVYLKDIYYIESSNKKVIVHKKDGIFELYGKMDEFEEELGDSFYRCHRCFLVNMEKISAYSSDTIKLINGETLILAQKKYPEFIKAYMRYAKSGGVVNV